MRPISQKSSSNSVIGKKSQESMEPLPLRTKLIVIETLSTNIRRQLSCHFDDNYNYTECSVETKISSQFDWWSKIAKTIKISILCPFFVACPRSSLSNDTA